jgi:hypothetical protein
VTSGLPAPLGHLGLALLLLGLAAALPTAAYAQGDVCNGSVSIFYVSGQNFAIPGPTANASNTYRVRLTLGTAEIVGGATSTLGINAASFGLDCTDATVGNAPCTDDGAKVKFLGNIGNVSNCFDAGSSALGVVTSHSASASPNQVVFTFVDGASNPATLVLPADTAGAAACRFQFDVQVLEYSSADGTPNRVEQQAFYSDASCDNGLQTTGLASSGINTCGQLLPGGAGTADDLQVACNDGNGCTLDTCNTTNGVCSFVDNVTSTCGDGNACTVDACNPANGQCTHTDNVTSTCGDGNACTVDACNPANGQCTHTDNVTSTCGDGNACTVDACNPANGQCTHTDNVTSTCGDGNACNGIETCNPANGQCAPGTPVICGDGNLCNGSEICNPANGQCDPGTPVNCNDGNACTVDACNPQTGQCTHTGTCEPIPTLSEWAQIGLALFMTAGAGWHLRRRRTLKRG